MSVWLWVGLGGAIGACARFGVAQLLPVVHYPWPTLIVNALGGVLIGALVGAFSQTLWFSEFGRAALVTGVLGGFTTFSAFSLEVVQLAQAGHAATAIGYAVVSVVVVVLGTWAGLSVGGALSGSIQGAGP